MTEETARALGYERSAGTCELDGQETATDWAHRRAQGQGGGWVASNGLHLCRRCHEWTEVNPRAAHLGGWRMVHDHTDPAMVPVWLQPRLAWPGWWILGDDGVYYPVDQGDPPDLPEWVSRRS
jgi:hypothetical protein